MIVPLDFRDVILGRLRGSWGVRGRRSSWTEEDEEEAEEAELGMSTVAAGSFTVGSPDGDSVAILCFPAVYAVAVSSSGRADAG
jgi:hypothetical protein